MEGRLTGKCQSHKTNDANLQTQYVHDEMSMVVVGYTVVYPWAVAAAVSVVFHVD
jgi:hypothetical protein